MKLAAIFSTIFVTMTIFVYSQSNDLIILKNIVLPQDTVLTKQLINSLNEFLALKEKPNNENTFVLKENLLETSALLDEFKGIEKSSKFKDEYFYKGYLTNLTQLNDSDFLIQFSYLGLNESTPLLRASFTLSALKKGNQFYFYSPLKPNTKAWKNKTLGITKLYFKNTLNTSKATIYLNTIEKFDKKLNAPKLISEFYCCENFHEALQLIGVDYKSDYNGFNHNILTSLEKNINLIVNGTLTSDFTTFDPHDLWHSRLHKVLSNSIINRPVDEGTAYLYGGSWGISWQQIVMKFKAFTAANPNADWIALYNESKNFDEKGKYPLNVDFMINALLVQKIEKEKGFSAVIELLSCGKKEKENENYFMALEKITGITKANFNANVWSLIKTI